jgi:sulfonate transport system permease protein
MMFNKQVKSLRGFIVPLFLLIAIELALTIYEVENDAIAVPSAVIGTLLKSMSDGTLIDSTFYTIQCVLSGILFSMAIGIPLGLSIGLSKFVEAISSYLIEVLRPVPSIALMPLAMLILGIGYKMETSVITYTCVWPMLIMTIHATQQIEKRHLEVAKTLKLGIFKKLTAIYIPSILPRIMVAARLTSAVALVVAITVEISGNPEGLGNLMINAQQSLNPELMWATLIWIALLGWGINFIFIKVNSWLFKPEITGASI